MEIGVFVSLFTNVEVGVGFEGRYLKQNRIVICNIY